MTLIRICMLAMTVVCAAVILKQWKTDLLPLLRLGATVLFAIAALTAATPLVTYLRELTGADGVAEHAGILFKALGIGVLTQCCGDLCRECGESGIAGGVETFGKIEILLLCLPLIHRIMEAVKDLLTLGGGG